MHRVLLASVLGLHVAACDGDRTTPPPASAPDAAGPVRDADAKEQTDPSAAADGEIPPQNDRPAPDARLADGLRGQVVREGTALDLATATLHTSARHCREPRVPKVTIRLDAKKDVDPVIVITGDTETVRLGEKMTPRTDDDRSGERAVGIAVYASEEGRGAQHRLPKSAWVRFHALSLEGPVDVDFEASFGEYGTIEGAVRVDSSEVETCVVPAPPPPPG